jgi:hypothetical protein
LIEGSNRTNIIFVFLFGCLAWSLWLIRNDLVFNDVITSSPDVPIFCGISFMQRWEILSKEKDQLGIDAMITNLRHQLLYLQSED